MNSMFARMGAWVAGPKTKWITLAVWVLLVAVLSSVFPAVNKEENDKASTLPSRAWSVQAEKVQQQYWAGQDGESALLVWYRPGGLTQADLRLVQTVTKELRANPMPNQVGVAPFDRMPAPAITSMESKDGTTLVESVELKAQTADALAQKDVAQLQKLVAESAHSRAVVSRALSAPGLHVRITGPAGIAGDTISLFANVDVTLLISTVMLVLILLVLLYRSPLLAILPLVGVGFAYGVVSPILGALAKSGIITVDAESTSIMTVLLFGAGTDYCLFLVTRFREHLYISENRYSAMLAAAQGASGAIGMSAVTVVVSLLALLFAKSGSIHRFAVPFSLAVLIMAVAGLTLMPALLSIFGRASFYPFVPRTLAMEEARAQKRGRTLTHAARRKLSGARAGRFSTWLGHAVSTKPWPILIVGLAVLCALAGFAPTIRSTYDPLSQLPQSMQSLQGFEVLGAHYAPGLLAPVQVMVDAEGKSVAQLRGNLAALPFVKSVTTPVRSVVNPDYQRLQVTLKQNPYTLQSIGEIPMLRRTVQSTLRHAGVDAASRYWVGGESASQYDARHYNQQDDSRVIPIVIGIIAVLLFAYLRSLVAMVYLIATVLLSFFAALGAGWLFLHYVLGADSLQGGIVLYAFIFLVALGEDYNIFMVSRIWQESRKRPLRAAIAEGVTRTGGVITSAGLILAGTFAVLTGMPGTILLDFGTIAAIGVLLDTFVVRPLVVPAITALLGRVAFWPLRAHQAGEAAHAASDGVTLEV